MALDDKETATVGAVPLLTQDEVIKKLRESAAKNLTKWSPMPLAFYSSVIGGITTDQALFVVPIDDHMVHRGHGIFDTCLVYSGRAYQLDQHLDRLLKSAVGAGIKPTQTREELRNIILATAAVPGKPDIDLRFWLSVGRGGFSCGPSECAAGGTNFYCIAHDFPPADPKKYEKGASLVTATTPMKPGLFAMVKSTNYLPNALVSAEADAAGTTHAVWVDERGMVAESAVANIAFVIEDGVLSVPKFDRTLAGVTMRRVMEIAIAQGIVKRVDQRDITLTEAKAAKEVMLIGSTTNALSVLHWDGNVVGDGKPGPIAEKIRLALWNDRMTARDQLVDVPGLIDLVK